MEELDSSNVDSSVVLFGGSFDPPHLGHLEIIKKLDSIYKRVVVIPAFCNPFKHKPKASIHTRIAWLRELCAGANRVEISDFEARANRIVYAIEYVRYYASECGGVALALGSDALVSLPSWREASEIMRLARIVPIVRELGDCELGGSKASSVSGQTSLQALESKGKKAWLESIVAHIDSSAIATPLHITGFPISSTQIRAALERGEFEQVARWIPPSIAPSVRKIYYNTR